MSSYVRALRRRVGHELLLLPSVTALVFDERRRMLLVHDVSTDRWVTPGGGIEPGDTPAETLVREVSEEVGLIVEPRRIAGVFGGRPEFVITYGNGDVVAYVMTVFECAVVGGALRPDGDEVQATAWVAESDFGGYDLAPWARIVLPPMFAPGPQAMFEPVRR
jgi:8-oxo-dGTP pyrophosphatase MutT (NUDIX family)